MIIVTTKRFFSHYHAAPHGEATVRFDRDHGRIKSAHKTKENQFITTVISKFISSNERLDDGYRR